LPFASGLLRLAAIAVDLHPRGIHRLEAAGRLRRVVDEHVTGRISAGIGSRRMHCDE